MQAQHWPIVIWTLLIPASLSAQEKAETSPPPAVVSLDTSSETSENELTEDSAPVTDAGPTDLEADATTVGYDIERINVNRLLNEQAYDSAANAGKRLVVTAIEDYGRDSLETADSLTLLAHAQTRSGDHDAAVENFRSAIEIKEELTDRLDQSLIGPLRGLGRAHLALNRPDRAAESFERSLHIKQVNEGPQNIGQVGQLGELTEAYYLMGDFKQAHALQKLSVMLHEREYPEAGDKRRIPSLYQYARWLNRMGLFMREQAAYIQIIRTIERSEGKKSLELIPALTGLGKTYIYTIESESQAVGERRFRRAISIAANAGNPVLVADTEISLGDFYTLTGDRTSAKRAYLRAWDQLVESEADLSEELARRFAAPYPLTTQDARSESFTNTSVEDFKNSLGSGPENGYVILGYQISKRGTVRDIEVIEAEPAGLRDDDAVDWVRKFKFRPRVVERKLLETPDQVYEYRFTYYPSALPTTAEAK